MRPVHQLLITSLAGLGAALAALLPPARAPSAAPAGAVKPVEVWKVEDLRAGMKGHGRTVLKGTRVETFQAEVLGILHNMSPGRDLVLARLSGLGLEKTGVIAGMSGSPIYVEGKLVGAVAYAWPFGKEPIAGVTPFAQMHSFVEALEKRELAGRARPVRVGLRQPLQIGGRSFESVTVAQGHDDAEGDRQGLWMVPLRTPLAATGLTRHSLKLFAERTSRFGLVPVLGGATTDKVAEEAKTAVLEPGGPVAVSLMTGDFDLSGIGTVTHVEGDRVYGWGHPFLSLGACQVPMMTGYIHTIYPRQTVSFKMGSPLREVGVVHADVSTCIAGHTGKKADMLPMRMTVRTGEDKARTFNVQLARHRTVLPALAYTALTNSVDMEGELPEDLTAYLNVKVTLEGGETIQIKDQFSALTGGRAPAVLYNFVANVLSQLAYNPFRELRISRIDCETRVEPGRTTAEIEAVELDADTYSPGDTVRATVTLRPYRGARQRVALELRLPADLAEG